MLKPLPVIIDTDIGTDVDDAYAVLFALASPEISVEALTLVHGAVMLRAKIAAKLLKLAGRQEIPILLGEELPMDRNRPVYWAGHEGRGIDFSDVENVPLRPGRAAEFIAEAAAQRPGEILLITIGPMTNAGVLLRDFPDEASKLRGIVAMASTFNGFGRDNAAKEHNASMDPEAMNLVLESRLPVLLVGLNITLKTRLYRQDVEHIKATRTPLGDFMAQMTEDWLTVIGADMTYMHDPLAVAASFEPSIVEAVPVTAKVHTNEPGLVSYFEADESATVRICSSANIERFQKLFIERIMTAVSA